MHRPVCFHLHAPFGPALIVLMVSVVFPLSVAAEDPYAAARDRMVDDIMRPIWGRTPVRDEAVLKAMRTVPRHKFVGESVDLAYADRPLPIGRGQTISQPYIVAAMTEALQAKAGDVVLEIGTGSGYQAAVLAEIVGEVYTIEIIPELGRSAAAVLTQLGYQNIHTRIGDGYKGWTEHAPYDGILVTAAPDHIPQPLVDQLKTGGRMVIPVGPQRAVQKLLLIEKNEDGSIVKRTLEDVRFVPLTREEE